MKEYTASQVWAAAAAAHRVNGSYIKESVWDYNSSEPVMVKQSNKRLVPEWLKTDSDVITAADVIEGEKIRDHFRGYMLLAMKGELNDFQKQAFRLAQLETLKSTDRLELAIISCLPSVYHRDNDRKDIAAKVRESAPLTYAVGSKITGEITVISNSYSRQFNKYKIQATLDDTVVDFWFTENPTVGSTLRISGKIKENRGNKTTQLNYVKII